MFGIPPLKAKMTRYSKSLGRHAPLATPMIISNDFFIHLHCPQEFFYRPAAAPASLCWTLLTFFKVNVGRILGAKLAKRLQSAQGHLGVLDIPETTWTFQNSQVSQLYDNAAGMLDLFNGNLFNFVKPPNHGPWGPAPNSWHHTFT